MTHAEAITTNKIRLCLSCAHVSASQFHTPMSCGHQQCSQVNPSDGKRYQDDTVFARSTKGKCGPEARLFEPKQKDAA